MVNSSDVWLKNTESTSTAHGLADRALPAFTLESRISRAENARNASTGLIATSVAVLTFVLFFLYPNDQAGRIDRSLFHLTLGIIVAALFSLGFTSVFYNRIMGDLFRGGPTSHFNVVASNMFLGLGLALLTLFPALVLFTIGIEDVALLAFALWLVLEVVVIASWRNFAKIE